MKLYGGTPGASIDMSADPVLREKLAALLRETATDVVIETGTFLGMGSTRLICNALAGRAPKRFVTLEVNFANWCRAKSNLRDVAYVECRWARSVATDRALDFLRHDPALLDHTKFPDIYIDNVINPVAAYSRELVGEATELERHPLADGGASVTNDARTLLFDGEDMLARLLAVHADHAPLIVLDSAGGIGLLEFQIVLERMAGRTYTLLLDDTHHIKHFRSLQFVRNSPEFEVVAEGASWALARRG